MLSPSHGRPRAGRITLAALTLTLATQLVPLGGVVGPGKAAAATVCGSGEPLRGIDVSKYQGQIDWPAVAASGIKSGITRIGDGVNIPDWTFQPNYAAMRANGIIPLDRNRFEAGQWATLEWLSTSRAISRSERWMACARIVRAPRPPARS